MKTRKLRKFLLMLASAMLLVSVTVGATVAYLTSTTEVVTNTFTVGNVKITLDEAKVDEYGVAVTPASRVSENNYKLIPGHTYTKDPTVHVAAKSEKSYIRMLVTVEGLDELKEVFPTYVADDGVFLLQNLVGEWDAKDWVSTSVTGSTYEFRYFTTVDNSKSDKQLDLPALFTSITVPDSVTNEELAKLNGVEINVVAQAIQADGFDDADAAWAAFPSNN